MAVLGGGVFGIGDVDDLELGSVEEKAAQLVGNLVRGNELPDPIAPQHAPRDAQSLVFG